MNMILPLEKRLLYALLTVFVLIQVFLLLLSDSVYGFYGADNVAHYQIARFSFRYPELFLDLWGKPVFTTLLAPFAQLGFKAAKGFNIMISVFTLLLSAKISKRLFQVNSFFIVALIAFAPVYFMLSISCLTEILFSFVLVSAVYLFILNRHLLAAVVLSFLPFVRSEGVVILPVFAVVWYLSRNSRFIPFLFFGAIFYSITGYFVFDDFLWIIHKQPYSLGESIYGSGSLFHFVKHSHSIFGIPLLIFIVTGLILWIAGILKKFSLQNPNTIMFILIAGSWITYFAAHSYVWWKGIGGSLGLTRVMGGIIPFAALTGMKTFEFISEKIKKKNINYGIFSAFTILQIILLFSQNNLLLKADPIEQLIKKSADYIRYNEKGEKVFYFNPLVIHFLELDPYDTQKCNWWVADKQQPSNSMEWGDLLVWDAHFGPNEGKVQLKNMEKDPYLEKVKSFYPLEKITVLGGYDYSIQLFKKSRKKTPAKARKSTIKRILTFEDFNDEKVVDVKGEKFFQMDKTREFSPGITILIDEIEQKEFLEFDISLDYFSIDNIEKDDVSLVFSIEQDNKNLRWENRDLFSRGSSRDTVQISTKLPAVLPESTVIKVYVWNNGRKKLNLKKLSVKIDSY